MGGGGTEGILICLWSGLIYPSANVTGVMVVATNTTSVRVSWLAVQGLPQDGILTGYTVYYRSLPNTSKRQSGGYISQTFPPTTTSGDITNLSPNGVYQFSVVAMVTIAGQSYNGDIPSSGSDTPTITPGKLHCHHLTTKSTSLLPPLPTS